MHRIINLREKVKVISIKYNTDEIQTELIRKFIHMLIALVPSLAAINVGITTVLIGMGTIFYTYFEVLRNKGYKIAFVSFLTVSASRERDMGNFVLGPVTLGFGAMLALMLYPLPASTFAIYALAFGDGISSIFGKLIGGIKIPFTNGKTMVGSLACFTIIFIIAFRMTGSIYKSIVLASVTTFVEALPIKDFDNIIIPVVSGLAAFELIV